MSSNSEKNQLPLLIGGTTILFRSHLYRHLRKLIFPISLFALYYRYNQIHLSKDEIDSLLVVICKYLQQYHHHISILGGDVLGAYLIYQTSKSLAKIWSYDPASLYSLITDSLFSMIKSFPLVRQKLDQEREGVDKLVDEEMKSKIRTMGPKYATLPLSGQSSEEILEFLKSLVRKEDLIWENGKVSGAVYHGDRNHQELLNAAFGLYSLANPLHPDMWPSSTKLESEIISMTANLMTTKLKTICG